MPTTHSSTSKSPGLKFEVRVSEISGNGIFATSLIRKGETVLTWNPKILTPEEAKGLPEDEFAHYTIPEKGNILWMQPPERYVNHSCEANTHVVARSDVATRDIHEGEEITSDYINLETEDFKCNCGSKNCRGINRGQGGEW